MSRRLGYTNTAADYALSAVVANAGFVRGDTLMTPHEALWYVEAVQTEHGFAWCRNVRTGDYQTISLRLTLAWIVVDHDASVDPPPCPDCGK